MRGYRRGLVVGKFCPLHRGHMFLIERALQACDEVLVISYTKPEFARCDTAVRDGWLAALFPQVERLVVDDAVLAQACGRGQIDRLLTLPHNEDPADVHRDFCACLCWNLGGGAVDAVFTSEDYGDGFAAVLSAFFSLRLGREHRVDHVCVDPARVAVPVSGTQVRSDPAAWRDALDPLVYSDLVDRICILGGESSGKTTLVEALAAALGTVGVPEVGRTRWVEKGGRFVYADMRAIAEDQVAHEIALAQQAPGPLVCDGSALTTLFYSQDGYGKVDPVVSRLAARRYTHTFVCAPDFPFVQDGTRRDAAFRQRQHDWFLRTLDEMGVAYTILSGPLDARLAAALAILNAAARSENCD
ncbi:MAG: AAA family ATPase [Pseudomonadota bacterium]